MDIWERNIIINKYEYQLLMKSFQFITHNRDITNDRLPPVYLFFWGVDGFLEKPNQMPSDAQDMVFKFIVKRSLRHSPHLKPLLQSYHFRWLFHYFQVILATTSYAQSNNIAIKPVKLFDLNDYMVPNLTNPTELLAEYQHISEKKIFI